MASQSFKAPPALSKRHTYDMWLKEIKIWECFTDLPKRKQAPAIFLTLEGKAREAVLQLPVDSLNCDDGIANVVKQLDKLFLVDKAQSAYQTYDSFEKLRRPSNMTMSDYINEFERLLNKTKINCTEMSSDILAYRLLKSANLSEHHEQLTRATITELSYESMKLQLKKIFGDSSEMNKTSSTSSSQVKVEPIMEASHVTDEEFPSNEHEGYGHHADYDEEAFYYSSNNKPWHNSRGYPQRSSANFSRGSFSSGKPSYNCLSRGSFKTGKGKNPLDQQGRRTRCSNCESVNHWYADCPDIKGNNSSQRDVQVTLFQSIQEETKCMQQFVGESLGAAVLDSGASKTVCGNTWMSCYIDALSLDEKASVLHSDSSTVFKFGDGKRVPSTKKMTVPACIGNQRVMIETDVIDSDIPLLLSKPAMKKAGTKIDFLSDTVQMLGVKQDLLITSSGHYAVPIWRNKQVLDAVSDLGDVNISFVAVSVSLDDKVKVATKLHKQFSHPSEDKLIKLVNSAGYANDLELKEAIRNVSATCKICEIYKHPSPRPVVGMPMARQFNECVAMDLKQYGVGVWFLNLIDHATRFCASAVIRSKASDVIIREIFRIWICIFGPPQKFLSDNEGEFSNSSFRDMCETMNIVVKTTAAESPWSNGLCERHNGVLAETVTKTVEDASCDIVVGLSWAVHDKNALQNVHGFSPYQLVFGKNPKLPCLIDNNLPALEDLPADEQIAANLNAMHKARSSFIASESSENIRRALRHNVRPSQNSRYLTGDSVFYKRNDSHRWRGPGNVLGQDGQQILIRHGGVYIRAHPCRVIFAKGNNQNLDPNDNLEEPSSLITDSDKRKENVLPHDDESSVSSDDEARNETSSIADDASNNIFEPATNSANILEPAENSANILEPAVNSEKSSEYSAVISLPKPKQNIKYVMNGCDEWVQGSVVSRAGKASGKYKYLMNINENDKIKEIDFEKDISKWEPLKEVPNAVEEVLIAQSVKDVCASDLLKAKQEELQNWRDKDVFTEVEDENQLCISVRWVITHKMIENCPRVKARLVARGFEEFCEFRTDSPTCMRENLRVVLSIISAKKWQCRSIDIKAAFLQGKPIDRVVFLKPPVEAYTKKLCKLNKCVYGLNDASRVWYMRVKECLLKLGVSLSSYDQAHFYWHDSGVLSGVIMCHVDDFLFAGTDEFIQTVIMPFKNTFSVGLECESSFKYIGINLIQRGNRLTVDQQSYIDSINPVEISSERRSEKEAATSDLEKSQFRSLVGQLNWVATQSRPDISFENCENSTNFKNSRVSDILQANKTLRHLKGESVEIRFPSLSDLKDLSVVAFADASYANLRDGGSQGGFVIFIMDNKKNACPIAWSSKRIKRVVKSTLAAETLSMVEAAEMAYLMSCLIGEIIFGTKTVLLITCYTDNKSLYESVNSTKNVIDKRLRVDIAILREMQVRAEITISWIEASGQVSDALTKKGASSSLLFKVLREGLLFA